MQLPSVHTAFGPQGEGLQGSAGLGGSSIAKFNKFNIKKKKKEKILYNLDYEYEKEN